MEPGERSPLPLFVAVVKRVPGTPTGDGARDKRADVASSSLFRKDVLTTPSGSGNVARPDWLSGKHLDTHSGVFGAVEPILSQGLVTGVWENAVDSGSDWRLLQAYLGSI